jgi:hypothetical protein
MKITTLARSLAMIAVCGFAASARAQAPTAAPSPPPATAPAAAPVTPLQYKLSPYLPHDTFDPIAGATDTQGAVDVLSWEVFIALNWPASETQNGVPDANTIVGGQQVTSYYPKGMRNGPTVWETFKDSNDIFLPNAKPPAPFSAKTQHVLFDDTESFTKSPLNDQNGRHVYYEVRLNEVEFNYIVEHKIYNSKNQKLPLVIDFPRGSNVTSEVGSVHVKAAWKILNLDGPGQRDDPSRFYTAQALIYTRGAPSAFLATVGLVGLHIAHKTASRPEWIWSTFEQVDNAPDMPASGQSIPPPPSPPGHYNFTNPDCPIAQCPPNQQVDKTSDKPVQVLRVTPIDPAVAGLNAQYQFALRHWNPKNVWQYYQLVRTQWPAKPSDIAKFGDPKPVFLANSVIETFFQGPSPANPTGQNPPHSCLDCHGMFAREKDFMFQLHKAQPQPATEPVPGIFDPPPPAARR